MQEPLYFVWVAVCLALSPAKPFNTLCPVIHDRAGPDRMVQVGDKLRLDGSSYMVVGINLTTTELADWQGQVLS